MLEAVPAAKLLKHEEISFCGPLHPWIDDSVKVNDAAQFDPVLEILAHPLGYFLEDIGVFAVCIIKARGVNQIDP